MKKAIFAGTFDPVTKGHEWVIEKATNLFDEVIVAVCVNAEKVTKFSLDIRLEMLNAVCKKYKNAKVVYHGGMLVDYMKENGIIYTVRGIRNSTDYEYERKMHDFNLSLYPELVTLYIPCDNELKSISSTAVRLDIDGGESLTEKLSNEVIAIIEKNNK